MQERRFKDASDAANALVAFDDSNVFNGTADGTAPTLTSATVSGTAVELNFSEALQTTDTLTNSLFTVEYSTDKGGSWTTQAHTVAGNSSDFSNNDSTITLTLSSAIADEAQVRVSYAGTKVTDASDAENALVAFDDSNVVNGTADSDAPTLTSATVVGTAVKLNFSEALQTTDTLTNSLFTVEYSTDGGGTWSTQTHSVNGNSSDFSNGGSTIALTLASAIADEAQVRVSYAGTKVTDASDVENALVAFDDSVVINGSADNTAPILSSATVDGTDVLLTFSEPLQDTQILTNGLFTVEYSLDAGTTWSTQSHSVLGSSSDYLNNGSTH